MELPKRPNLLYRYGDLRILAAAITLAVTTAVTAVTLATAFDAY